MKGLIKFKPHFMMCALLIYLLSACNMKEELEGYEILDRVRILAVKSEPPDLMAGEEATLSALVYNPEDQEMSYAWSWCPVRNGSREGFTCAIEEEALQAIWAELDNGKDLPAYSLGNEATAEFPNVFDGETVFELCAIMMEEEGLDELALFSCVMGLQISVELRMSSGDQEWVALKNLEIILDKEEAQRNANPKIKADMREINLIVPREKMSPLKEPVEAGAALYEGSRYEFVADIDEEESEIFQPPKLKGVEESTGESEKRENLYIDWFVTKDAVKSGLRGTLFVDDGIRFDDLITNEVGIAETVRSGELHIYLVIRDERGGVGWMDYRFDVEAAQ